MGFSLGRDDFPNYKNFIVVPSYFTPDECDLIKITGHEFNVSTSTTVGSKKPAEFVRKSKNSWIRDQFSTRWLFTKLHKLVKEVNIAHYAFELDFMESLQFTVYEPVGSHYRYHMDFGPGTPFRKLSCVVMLDSFNDYEGGELELFCGGPPSTPLLNKGDAILFPSFIPHRVNKVTSGLRNSLVCWVHGPRFR